MTSTLKVDDLAFEIRWSKRRKTVQLTVDREGGLVIAAPVGCEPAMLRKVVREKQFWIYTKLAAKEQLNPPIPAKQFVAGEGFQYLGRSYRLKLVRTQDEPLRLERGRFCLRHADRARGQEVFVAWYKAHAKPWLEKRVCEFAPRFQAKDVTVRVSDLGHRWGSCGKNRTLNFHWASILLPASLVEYIVVHELMHLCEPHHTPQFWLSVERCLPDFASRRARLAVRGGEIRGL